MVTKFISLLLLYSKVSLFWAAEGDPSTYYRQLGPLRLKPGGEARRLEKFREDLITVYTIVHDTGQDGHSNFIRLSIGEFVLRNGRRCHHTRTVPHENSLELCKMWECTYDLETETQMPQYVDWAELNTAHGITQVHLLRGQLVSPDLINVTIKDCGSGRCGGTSVVEFKGLDLTLLHSFTGNEVMTLVMIQELRPVVQELLGQLVKHEFEAAIQICPCH